jgi:hypothetical protein
MKSHTSNSRRLNLTGYVHKSDQEIFSSVLKQWGQRLGYCSIVAAVPAVLLSNLPVSHTAQAKKPQARVIGKERRNPAKLDLSLSKRALLKRQSTFLLPHQSNSGGLTPLSAFDDCPGLSIPAGNYPAAATYIDSGDTTGANNTVSSVYMYSFGYQTIGTAGPDHVYAFTLTGRGPNPQIEVSTTSGTYRPLVYVLEGGFAGACPAGTGRDVYNGLMYSAGSPGSPARINSQLMNWLPLNVPLYLLVDSPFNDEFGSGPYTIKMQDVTIAPTASPNVIDGAEFFVRQHYVDFLNRQPDPEGMAFWTNQITSCGSDQACIEVKRINDSGSFFLSIEFQETGYLVYRTYLAAFGNLPNAPVPITFYDFANDTWLLGRNVIVRQAGWEQVLENNKRSFALDFVQRARFTNAFPPAMSPQEFVDQLNANAGHPLSQTERDQLVSDLSGGRRSRAEVLRAIAENPNLAQAEFNRAFVLMQYFGYLRRNPNDAPDGNFVGYNFWLDKLNSFNGDFIAAEMVKAFISSTEYRSRFGP